MAYFVSESLHLKLAAKVSYSTCEEERKRERDLIRNSEEVFYDC